MHAQLHLIKNVYVNDLSPSVMHVIKRLQPEHTEKSVTDGLSYARVEKANKFSKIPTRTIRHQSGPIAPFIYPNR